MRLPAVLVLDEQNELYQLISRFLQNQYRVVGRRSADLTMKMIEKERFDVIVVGPGPSVAFNLEKNFRTIFVKFWRKKQKNNNLRWDRT